MLIQLRIFLRGCLYEPYLRAGPTIGETSLLIYFPNKNGLRLHEARASPTRGDLAVDKARSRLLGVEIFYVNATRRAGPSSRAE